MGNITPELQGKFLRFREVYEFTLEKLQQEGASGSVVAVKVWEAAQQEVPLTPKELRIYKMHVALHSVNGGELFADASLEDS